MKKTSSAKQGKHRAHYLFLAFTAILLAVGIAVDILYPLYSQVINNALGKEARASDDIVQSTLANSRSINIQLQEEGSVLLKNEGNVLPLSVTNNKKVNVYGILSAHHYKGGSGSSSTNSEAADLKTALESEGFEVNEAIWKLIQSSELGYATGSTVDNGAAGQYELAISEYEKAMSFADAKAYSDTAVITFGSNGGEGSDGVRTDDGNSLELGENEKALLKRLDEEGFTIIALINSSYVMELGPVVQHADAILWVGGTGLYGTYGIATLLDGKANPSGRLVDTWMYEQETASNYYTSNSAEAAYVDESGKAIGSYTNCSEGIYVGYRWYETADAEGYWDYVSNEYGSGYEGVVAYPFGYGLSYTTFEEKIIHVAAQDSAEHGPQYVFTVQAANTGSVAGKDVIELYVQKPYTNGGVETAQVELVGFGKTQMLKPGASETVTITVSVEDLPSYDVNADGGNGAYVLAGGDYIFHLASAQSGAHCWKTNQGSADRTYTAALDEIVYAGENKRPSDAVAASNQLETTACDTGIASNDASAGYVALSRKDGFDNASETISREANTRGGTINGPVTLAADSALYQALKANYGSNTYTTFNTDHLKDIVEFANPALEQEKQYTLADLYTTDADGKALTKVSNGKITVVKEVDYDDPRWEALISQMSLDELDELIGRGGYGTIAVASIEKEASTDYDGPTGFSNFLKASMDIAQETTGFSSEPIMAATWNVELIEEYGRAVGQEGNAFGNNGWYAPGMNLHRSPFGGRNGEYFSEDPLLTGMMAASVAYGAFEEGVYTYAKHFAFNELEARRSNGSNVIMSEQTARQLYLKSFEIAIKQKKLTGLMSSFMLMNAQWNGGNYNLMHNIVRTEWDFRGVINTDLAGAAIMGAERALCAGTDLLLATSYAKNQRSAFLRCDTIKQTEEGVLAMKTAAKHILYANASASLHRSLGVAAVDTSLVSALYIGLNVLAYAGASIMLILFIIFHRKSRMAKITVEK